MTGFITLIRGISCGEDISDKGGELLQAAFVLDRDNQDKGEISVHAD